MFTQNIFEQSTLEWLWNQADKGFLKAEKTKAGDYEFFMAESSLPFKDRLVREFEEKLAKLARFYLSAFHPK